MSNKLEAYVRKDGEFDLIATIDTEEFIVNNLEENKELQTEYDNFREDHDMPDAYHSAEEFAKHKGGKGIFGEGEPIVLNTCNEESLLSDVLQLVYWTDDNGEHVILERHLGGDLRGNYGPQQAYDATQEQGVFFHANGLISCQDCSEEWITNDAFHWSNKNELKDLQDYKASDSIPDYHEYNHPTQKSLLDVPLSGWTNSNIVFVDENRRPHCPYCGGLLEINRC